MKKLILFLLLFCQSILADNWEFEKYKDEVNSTNYSFYLYSDSIKEYVTMFCTETLPALKNTAHFTGKGSKFC